MAKIQLHPTRTDLTNPAAAADDLLDQLGDVTPKLAVLFASRDRDHVALNQALRERLPQETRLIGATTEGEIDNEGLHSGKAVLGALTGDFEIGLGLGRGLSTDAVSAGATAGPRSGWRPNTLPPRTLILRLWIIPTSSNPRSTANMSTADCRQDSSQP